MGKFDAGWSGYKAQVLGGDDDTRARRAFYSGAMEALCLLQKGVEADDIVKELETFTKVEFGPFRKT